MDKINKPRASRRLPYQNEIEIVGSNGQYCKGKIINISQEGMCIETDTDLSADSDIISRITLGSEICELKGKIAWSNKIQNVDKYKIGVNLDRIPDEFIELYQKIINKFNSSDTGSSKKPIYEPNLVHKV